MWFGVVCVSVCEWVCEWGVSVCVSVCLWVCVFASVSVSVCVRVCECVWVCEWGRECVCVWVWVYVSVCVSVCVNVCVSECLWVWTDATVTLYTYSELRLRNKGWFFTPISCFVCCDMCSRHRYGCWGHLMDRRGQTPLVNQHISQFVVTNVGIKVVWKFWRKRKWCKLNDKLRHLADSPITEKERTRLNYAEGKAEKKMRGKFISLHQPAAQARMNTMRNNILEELLIH